MHELSIATAIVDMAEEEAERRDATIAAVYLRLGGLSGVAREALEPAFELAAEGTRLAGARLVIEEVPAGADLLVTALEISSAAVTPPAGAAPAGCS